jgi:hypothetical protein
MSSSSAAEDILSQQENAAMHLGINNMLDDVIEGPVQELPRPGWTWKMESASRVWSQETNDSDDTEVMGDLDTAEGAGAGDDDEMMEDAGGGSEVNIDSSFSVMSTKLWQQINGVYHLVDSAMAGCKVPGCEHKSVVTVCGLSICENKGVVAVCAAKDTQRREEDNRDAGTMVEFVHVLRELLAAYPLKPYKPKNHYAAHFDYSPNLERNIEPFVSCYSKSRAAGDIRGYFGMDIDHNGSSASTSTSASATNGYSYVPVCPKIMCYMMQVPPTINDLDPRTSNKITNGKRRGASSPQSEIAAKKSTPNYNLRLLGPSDAVNPRNEAEHERPYTSYERETLDAAMIYAYRDESVPDDDHEVSMFSVSTTSTGPDLEKVLRDIFGPSPDNSYSSDNELIEPKAADEWKELPFNLD